VGVPQDRLLQFYSGVIRPVLEYAAPVWNHLLTRKVYKLTNSKRYKGELSRSFTAKLTSCLTLTHYIVLPFLASQTVGNSYRTSFFFKSVQEPSSCLYSLLPAHGIPRLQLDEDSQTNFFASPAVRTKYQTFISRACLIIKLHKHSTTYFSILLVFFISSTSVLLYISIHCIVYC